MLLNDHFRFEMAGGNLINELTPQTTNIQRSAIMVENSIFYESMEEFKTKIGKSIK